MSSYRMLLWCLLLFYMTCSEIENETKQDPLCVEKENCSKKLFFSISFFKGIVTPKNWTVE